MRGTDDKFDTVTIHDPEKDRMAREIAKLRQTVLDEQARYGEACEENRKLREELEVLKKPKAAVMNREPLPGWRLIRGKFKFK